ncbi:MAG: hypothetical protein AUH85_16710 [Chloroflexi bacterium 13_1_40CM_4_68_4]|nr:MAG: hypothetical protein AUH85_16710 [Chloroflexi bacterium 13_1_40CM_4_68_4]
MSSSRETCVRAGASSTSCVATAAPSCSARSRRDARRRLAQAYLARIGKRGAEFRLELIAVELRGTEPDRIRIVPFDS